MVSESPATPETPNRDGGNTRNNGVNDNFRDSYDGHSEDGSPRRGVTSSTPALLMATGSAKPPTTVPLSTGAGPSRPPGKHYDAGY